MKAKHLLVLMLALLTAMTLLVSCGGGANTETDAGAVPGTDAATDTQPVEETDASGAHVHTPVEKIEEPTCESRGYKREVCATCGEQLSVKPIDMVDHVAAAEATCTEGSVCKFCGIAISPALGHTMGDVIDSKPATKTEAGYEKAVCSACGLEVTTVIPAGITENFNNIPAGALSKDVMAANSVLAENFTFDGFQEGGFEIVTEGGNSYLKKLGANAQLKFNNTDLLNSEKLEFTFDFRLDAEQKSTKGLISLVNGKKEMRILNIRDNAVYFGMNDNGIIRVRGLEVGSWAKIKIVLDATTYNYEIYLDDVKCLYTVDRPDGSGRHDAYVLQEDGAYLIVAAANDDTLHDGNDRSPFYPAGDETTQFYFFHWSADLACSLDDLTIGFADAK